MSSFFLLLFLRPKLLCFNRDPTKPPQPPLQQQDNGREVTVDDCRDAEFKELILTNFAERIWPTLRDAGFDSMKSYQGITDE